MRVFLTASNFCKEPYVVYPLGMSVIARALEQAGHIAAQFDPLAAGGLTDYPAALARQLEEFRPGLIAVSLRNIDNIDSTAPDSHLLGEALNVIHCCRTYAPGVPVVLGGTGFSLYPETLLELSGCEYGVAGEGEAAMTELADALAKNAAPPAGTILRGRVAVPQGASYAPPIADFYVAETHMIPVQTKRGCPFHCAYCTYPLLEGRTVRTRPADEVLRDLALIRDRWPEALVFFVDAVFNDPGRAFEKLLRAMIAHDLTVPWTAFLTPGNLREGDLELMCRAGMVAAELGIDGASDAALAGLGKSFTFAEVRDCCRRLHELGVGMSASVMFGGPGETPATVREGIANLNALEGVHTMVFSGIRVLNGAPLLERARRERQIPEGWNGIGACYYFSPALDREALHQMLLEGFRDSRYVSYPPGKSHEMLRLIHKIGYRKMPGAGGRHA